ncbi:hypothetical protein [Paraburkholderia acidipaludis]|uniref:hypothetical protein n=1 Tax=Paraburkholderia acidipaludis TaxID=660537 RepID=UPI00157ABC6D
MMLWKNCLAAVLCAAAAAFVPAGAQTQVQGVVRPAVSASQPVVHAVPLNPPASAPSPVPRPAPSPAPQPAQQPAAKPVEKQAEKPAHKPAHKHVHEPTRKPAPQPAVQSAPPILPEPAPQPVERAAPQPYAQPVPAPQPVPQPYPQPAPAPQPYTSPAPAPQSASQPVVNWTLQVIRDGRQIDSFDGSAAVGQARTNTHHKLVTHDVGCRNQPAGSIDLQRTITVTPQRADPSAAVLAIEAQETVESDTTPRTREGCKLPPQPSEVRASHPGLIVPAGQWVEWQIVSQDPSLLYRVRASIAPPPAQP